MASYLSYNGVVIDLSRTTRYVQQPLYSPDGADYIGTRVTIEVEGLYAPGATSYTRIVDDDDQDLALALPGQLAPTTDLAVRRALATPRCQLLYVVGNVVVLRSPAEDATVDVAGGPTPQIWEASKLTERAWHVRFRVETTINECSPGLAGLMSNRWSQVHRIGEDHLTEIVTEGVAVFRLDHLAQVGKNADFFREELVPATPLSFQRKAIEVAVNPLGNVIQYRTVDRERFVDLGANEYGVVDFNAVVGAQSVPVGSGLSSVASEVMLGTFQGVAFGDKDAGYRSGNLLTWLLKLAIERLDLPTPGRSDSDNENYVIVQVGVQAAIDRPQVQLAITTRMPPAKEKREGLGPLRALELLADVRDSELFDGEGINPQLPRGNNTRGHYLGELYAQTLRVCLANCNEPQVPKVIAVVSPSLDYTPPEGTEPDADSGSMNDPGYEGDAYSDATKTGGQISYFEVRTHFETDRGTVVSPVCGDGTEPPQVFRLNNDVTLRVVEFEGERIGSKPPVPDPAAADAGEVLVGRPEVSFAPPIPAADGRSKVYRVAGRYTYARLDGKTVLEPGPEGLPMGAVPWATFRFDDESNRYRDDDRSRGITGPEYTGGQ